MKIHAIHLGAMAVAALATASCGAPEGGLDEDPPVGVEDLATEGEEVEAAESAPAAYAQPQPAGGYIERITTGGSGCPAPDDARVVLLADRSSFLMFFNKMRASSPPGPAVKNVNCSAGVSVRVPPGYQVAAASVVTLGRASLPLGARARVTSSAFFAGDPAGAPRHLALTGQYNKVYVLTDQPTLAPESWSTCGQSAILGVNASLNLNTVNNPGAAALVDASVQLVKLAWRKCP